jgi:hypothetical protein
MKADITKDECKALNTTLQAPKIVISMMPQQISNPKHSKITSLALKIWVPAAHENIYLNILDRLNKRASTLADSKVDIVLDENIGVFFPYYAKQSHPKLFNSLMLKQNAEMKLVSAIPLFGLTNDALKAIISDNEGNGNTVREWIYNNPHVI